MGSIIYFDIFLIAVFSLIWVASIFYLRQKKERGHIYLIFFTVFFIYMFKVLDYTLFQFQSLLVLKYFMPNLMLQGQAAEEAINFVPLITLTLEDIQTSLLNILLFVPFGFILPLITNFRMKKIVITGFVLSVSIEFLQLASGLIGETTFRIADINDVLFNTLGAALGYILFFALARTCRYLFNERKLV